jgi:hypothetical protein
VFSSPPGQGTATGGTTSAQVTWTTGPGLAPETCADQATPPVGVKLTQSAGEFQFSLAQAQPDVIQTRCAGPTIADVAEVLNPPELPISALLRGNTTVDLSSTGNFAAHGLSGSASSTIVLTLGRPQKSSISLTGNGHGKLVYRAALSGTVTERITADASTTTCGPLGACGQSGQLTFEFAGASGPAALFASGPASSPLSDYLSALGQQRGSMHKLLVLGAVSLAGGATLTSSVQQAGSSCADSLAVDQSTAAIARSGNRVGVDLFTGGSDGAAGRTRCPGPILPAVRGFAGGVVPVSALRRRVVTIDLERGVSFADNPYTVQLIPHLTLRLIRTGVSVKTYKVLANLLASG